MPVSRFLLAGAAIGLLTGAVCAEPTEYPLTLRNCGQTVTFEKAPKSAVTIGQSATEILYALGLADKIRGTSVWANDIQEKFREIDARVERITDNAPSFEAVAARQPELVAVQWEWNVGPKGDVATRDQFHELGIPTYILPVDCTDKNNLIGADGTRLAPLETDNILAGVRELAAIFDVSEKGEQVIAELKAQEARAVEQAKAARSDGASAVFWYSSSDKATDPFVAGAKGAPAWMLERLGMRNVIKSNEDWPLVGWETIASADPTIIVVARMSRRKYRADDVENKIAFLKSDPVTSQMSAVKENRIVIMDAHAMDPTMGTFDGLSILAGAFANANLATP